MPIKILKGCYLLPRSFWFPYPHAPLLPLRHIAPLPMCGANGLLAMQDRVFASHPERWLMRIIGLFVASGAIPTRRTANLALHKTGGDGGISATDALCRRTAVE